MTYATKQDLIDRFGELELLQRTDRVNVPQTTIDDEVVNEALNDASSTADGYLAAKYALPLATTPARLVKVTCDMARYYLHGEAASDAVRKAYEDAIAWLKDVSKGIVSLGLTAAGEATPAATGGPQICAQPGTFTRKTLEDF